MVTKVLLNSCFLMECIRQMSANEHEYVGIHTQVDTFLYNLCLRCLCVYIRTTQEKTNSPSSSLNC